MKSLKYLLFFAMMTALAVSCKKGLDPISTVDPGPDLLPPVVSITDPTDGKIMLSADTVGPVTLKFAASDDIELQSVTVFLDGAEIKDYTSFTDYRRMAPNIVVNLHDGDHVLTVDAVDKTGKTDSKTVNFRKVTAPPYDPMPNEVIYFPFDGSYLNYIGYSLAGVVGTPGFAEGKIGEAYAGASNSYLTYPSSTVTTTEFSVAFWYKINPDSVRAGIISISPQRPSEDRNFGLRVFRENEGSLKQKIGLNFGIGTAEVWMNPFITVNADSARAVWMHIAISISSSAKSAIIYVNGQVKMQNLDLKGDLNWTGCNPLMSIASGKPDFIYWQHFADQSLYDEMHFFTRAITAAEVQTLYNVKK